MRTSSFHVEPVHRLVAEDRRSSGSTWRPSSVRRPSFLRHPSPCRRHGGIRGLGIPPCRRHGDRRRQVGGDRHRAPGQGEAQVGRGVGPAGPAQPIRGSASGAGEPASQRRRSRKPTAASPRANGTIPQAREPTAASPRSNAEHAPGRGAGAPQCPGACSALPVRQRLRRMRWAPSQSSAETCPVSRLADGGQPTRDREVSRGTCRRPRRTEVDGPRTASRSLGRIVPTATGRRLPEAMPLGTTRAAA